LLLQLLLLLVQQLLLLQVCLQQRLQLVQLH
jgi:hypothetical protein